MVKFFSKKLFPNKISVAYQFVIFLKIIAKNIKSVIKKGLLFCF